MGMDDETGGDAACWSHLFDDYPDSGAPLDLMDFARTAEGHGPIWTKQTTDLNINLLRFNRGEGVAEHVNSEVDVLILSVAGFGSVTIDGAIHDLPAGALIVIPKGARRSIAVTGETFAYVTCHRRRAGLMPVVKPAAST